MFKKTLLFAIATLTAAMANAADFPKAGNVLVGATADYFFVGQSDDKANAADDLEDHGGFSVYGRYFLADDFSASVFTSYGQTDTVNLGGDVDAYSLGGGARKHFTNHALYGVRPALGAGVVVTRYESDDLDTTKTEVGIYAEAAAEKSINERWLFEAGIRGRLEVEDAYFDTQLFAGVSYRFGQTGPAPKPVKAKPEPKPKPKPVEAKPEPKAVVLANNEKPENIISTVILPETSIRFRVNSAVLADGFNPAILQEFADTLANSEDDLTIIVEGHTDSTGSKALNQNLSERRAETVLKVFTDNLGVADEKIEARGMGESRPIADNDTPEGRQENRRVEVKIRKN